MSPHAFDRYLGKILAHVSADLKADAAKHGYRVNVRDTDAPADIDREADRLDVRVDGDFVMAVADLWNEFVQSDDFMAAFEKAKQGVDRLLADAQSQFAVIVTHPEAVAACETLQKFGHRDRRRIKRELRKASQRVQAGTYVFRDPPPDAPVIDMGAS